MLTVTYANCYIEAPCADCRYAECRYAECRYAECRYVVCRGTIFKALNVGPLNMRRQEWASVFVTGKQYMSILQSSGGFNCSPVVNGLSYSGRVTMTKKYWSICPIWSPIRARRFELVSQIRLSCSCVYLNIKRSSLLGKSLIGTNYGEYVLTFHKEGFERGWEQRKEENRERGRGKRAGRGRRNEDRERGREEREKKR